MNPVVVLPKAPVPPQYIPTEELPEMACAEEKLRETIALILPALEAFSASAPAKLYKTPTEEERITGMNKI